jgi:hypothetical protein
METKMKKQEIVCNKGMCEEVDNDSSLHFEDLFAGQDAIGKMKRDQWLYNIYGVKTS